MKVLLAIMERHLAFSMKDIESGRLTCVGTVLQLKEGHVELTFNIRYSITAKGCEITEKLINYWNGKGFKWKTDRDSAPSFFDPSHPAIGALTETYNELTDRSLKPYTMGGGTYAENCQEHLDLELAICLK